MPIAASATVIGSGAAPAAAAAAASWRSAAVVCRPRSIADHSAPAQRCLQHVVCHAEDCRALRALCGSERTLLWSGLCQTTGWMAPCVQPALVQPWQQCPVHDDTCLSAVLRATHRKRFRSKW